MNSTANLTSVSDLYANLLEVKNGRADGAKLGCVTITKKDCKAAGIEWSFVEDAVQVLGLQIHRDGRWGYVITK